MLLRAEERRAFQMIDADGSGHLDLQEFQEALKERANLVLEDDLMAAVWRSYDDNNNGILDYRKFVGQVMNACAPPLPCLSAWRDALPPCANVAVQIV